MPLFYSNSSVLSLFLFLSSALLKGCFLDCSMWLQYILPKIDYCLFAWFIRPLYGSLRPSEVQGPVSQKFVRTIFALRIRLACVKV